jgi:hypothetical protein
VVEVSVNEVLGVSIEDEAHHGVEIIGCTENHIVFKTGDATPFGNTVGGESLSIGTNTASNTLVADFTSMLSSGEEEDIAECERLLLSTHSLNHVQSTEQFVLGGSAHVGEDWAIEASALLAGEHLEAAARCESSEHVVEHNGEVAWLLTEIVDFIKDSTVARGDNIFGEA